jgi:hypothetical protein
MAKEEVPINTQALAGRAGETTGVKNPETLSIDTKVTDFVTVQRSLEQIKAALEKLNSKQIGDGLTDELETEGVPGSIRIIKGTTDESYFEVKTEEGWRKPVVGETLVKFKTIESNDKEPSPKSIDELEAEDAGDGGNKANNTIYDEKGGKFILPRPDFSSSWYRVVKANFRHGQPRFMIEHGLGVFPTFFITWFAPGQGSGSHGDVVADSAITWITPINNSQEYAFDQGIVSKIDINYAIYGAGNDRLWRATNFLGTLADTDYADGCIKFVAWK